MVVTLRSRKYRIALRFLARAANGLWPWMVLGVAVVTVIVAVAGQSNDITVSGWRIAGQIYAWWVAIIAGIWLHQAIPCHLAQGTTRRETTVAYGMFGALFVLALAGVMTVGMFLERSVYEAFGWSYVLEGPLFAGAGPAAVAAGMFLWYVLVYGVCFALGSFFGVAAYREDRWTAFLGAPLAIVGVLLTGLVSLEFQEVRLKVADWPDAAWAAALAMFAVSVAVLAVRLLGDIPIRPRKA